MLDELGESQEIHREYSTASSIVTGIGSGPIILRESIDINDCRTFIEVRIKAMKKCAELMSKAIFGLESGQITAITQDPALAIKHPAFPNDKIKEVNEILEKTK